MLVIKKLLFIFSHFFWPNSIVFKKIFLKIQPSFLIYPYLSDWYCCEILDWIHISITLLICQINDMNTKADWLMYLNDTKMVGTIKYTRLGPLLAHNLRIHQFKRFLHEILLLQSPYSEKPNTNNTLLLNPSRNHTGKYSSYRL